MVPRGSKKTSEGTELNFVFLEKEGGGGRRAGLTVSTRWSNCTLCSFLTVHSHQRKTPLTQFTRGRKPTKSNKNGVSDFGIPREISVCVRARILGSRAMEAFVLAATLQPRAFHTCSQARKSGLQACLRACQCEAFQTVRRRSKFDRIRSNAQNLFANADRNVSCL